MVFPSLLVAAVVTASSTVASPAPAPSPLQEIGHVRASMCGALLVHANAAIAAALHNDLTLARTIARMRSADVEGNPIARRATMAELDKLSADLRDTAVHGDAEIKRLREMAEKATAEPQKTDLKTFANSLGGALYRQKKMASDLNGLMAYMDFQQMRAEFPNNNSPSPLPGGSSQMAGYARTNLPNPMQPQDPSGLYEHGSPNQMLLSAASDFQARMSDVQLDEAKAADHSEGAVSGC